MVHTGIAAEMQGTKNCLGQQQQLVHNQAR